MGFLKGKRTQLLNGQLMQSPCVSCGSGDFQLATEPNALLAQNSGSTHVVPLPIVTLLCSVCGAAQFFSKNYLETLMQQG